MVPSHLIPSLSAAADKAINNVLLVGAPGQSTPKTEVDFVAAVVIGGVPDIAAAWRPVLHPHGYSVRMSGVFCHQSPKATFSDIHGTSVSCELADLLVVVEDNTGGKVGRRWAALVQAKIASSGGGKTLSSSGDLRQLDLFTRWPAFTLPSGYLPGARDFSTCSYRGTKLDCGRYGLIEKHPSPDWRQQSPNASMPAGGDELGTFLAHMVETGQVGYGREATGLTDDWSQTVDELMTRTYAMFFTHVSGFSSPQQRGHSALAMSSSDPLLWPVPHPYILAGDIPPPSGGRPEVLGGEDGEEGISVLRISIGRAAE